MKYAVVGVFPHENINVAYLPNRPEENGCLVKGTRTDSHVFQDFLGLRSKGMTKGAEKNVLV